MRVGEHKREAEEGSVACGGEAAGGFFPFFFLQKRHCNFGVRQVKVLPAFGGWRVNVQEVWSARNALLKKYNKKFKEKKKTSVCC